MAGILVWSRRGLLAGALGLGLATPSLAETVTVSDIESQLSDGLTLSVPTVELTDASLDEAAVRTFLAAGQLKAKGNALLGLTARAVSIPELRIEGTLSDPGDPMPSEGALVLNGIALTDVAHGIAGGFSIESISFADGKGVAIDLGRFAVANLNMNYLFPLLGAGGTLASVDRRDLESLWSSLTLGGASVNTTDGSCTVAGIDGGAVAIRMLERTSLAQLFALIEKVQGGEPETDSDATARPRADEDDIARLQSYYFDALTSYAAGPLTLSGLECNLVTDDGDPILLSAGEVAVGAARPGTIPEMAIRDVRIENSGADAGWIALQELRAHPTDYTSVADAFADIGAQVSAAWAAANQRKLIPEAGGLALSGLTMDVPSQDSPDQRVIGGIGSFSVLLDSYLNGIPTDVRSSATGIRFSLPQDESGAMLEALGLDPLDLSYNLALRWDRAPREIVIDNLMMSAGNAGTIIVSGVLGNAQPRLFGLNRAAATRAAQALTIKELHLHIADAGLLPKLVAIAAAEQNIEPTAFRLALGAMAQGLLIAGLGGSEDSVGVAAAVSKFITAGGELSLSAVALSPAGVSLEELQQGQADPSLVVRRFAVTTGKPTETAAEEAASAEVPAPAPPTREVAPAHTAAPEVAAPAAPEQSSSGSTGDTPAEAGKEKSQ